MQKILAIFIGGGTGALLRYGLSGLIQTFSTATFPLGTLGVNCLGAFTIGFLWQFLADTMITPTLRSFIFVGILGAFTTFSTYSLETARLIQDHESILALLNIVLSNILSIGLVFGGMFLARAILSIIRQAP